MIKKFRAKNRLYHVVGTLKDGDETLVVIKTYIRYKQRWQYETLEMWLFNMWDKTDEKS